ncbi:MAG TPA: DNA-processing protein DprA [Candidatus Eremiobacteraceae bacterium]|nr:DNA-processing protein DprA [Candidatus Eremiobacteraceae bacterium]
MDSLDDGYAMAVAGALVWTPRLLRAWLDKCGSSREILAWVTEHDAPPEGAPALSRSAIERLRAIEDDKAHGAIEALAASGSRLVRDRDADYPVALNDLPDPPPLLYVRGSIEALGARAIAIVGSRAATTYGRQVAGSLAADLGAFGACIVSGLARGIDACAHGAALAAKAPTVAVIGSGISALYPPYHALLADEIVASGGAVVSEFPPREAARAHHFPMRNRLVAALARATVVVEAGRRSGALITARLAGDLGRDVYAIPGDVTRPTSVGTNDLIKDGVTLVTSGADIASLLGWDALFEREKATESSRDDPVLARLTAAGVDVVELAAACGMELPAMLARLTLLEIQGLAKRLPGGTYAAVKRERAPNARSR